MIDKAASQYGLNLAAGVLILIGWGGIFLLVQNVLPTPGARWVFFMLLYIAIVGTGLPFIRFLNHRFIGTFVSDAVIVRESLWFGLFVTTCAWLQIWRALSWPVAMLLALAIVVIEGFLRIRESYYDA
jgi:hypothetical protein